ncbi:MAG: AMP-binding protein, partial [Phycicoccus sp.]
MTNLAANLVSTAAAHPDQDALRVGGQGVTYAQLHGMAAEVAGALRANGIQPGDRVAVILPNVPAFPVVYWGILLAGGIVVPMNPLLKSGEIDFFFTNSGAKVAFVWPDFVGEATKGAARSGTRIVECGPMGPVEGALEGGDPVTEPAPREDDDTAIILYTSGTTGRPKGAELTHRNIHLNATRSAEVIQQMTP